MLALAERPAPIDIFCNETAISFKQVCESAGLGALDVIDYRPGTPRGLEGPHVALVGDAIKLQFALMAEADIHAILAQRLLQWEEGDDPLDRDDVIDAVSEVANMLAGSVKARVRKTDPTMRISLPIYIEGDVVDAGHGVDATMDFDIGGLKASLMIIIGGK